MVILALLISFAFFLLIGVPVAFALGLTPLSSPFDYTAVELLESLDVSAYKIASCEIVDYSLLDCVAQTGKPVILSTGAANIDEVEGALNRLTQKGSKNICLLHCISAYPTPIAEANLGTIPFLMKRFGFPVGFSDHTIGIAAPIAAVALGACVIEKHVYLAENGDTVDAGFSSTVVELGEINIRCREVFRAVRSIKTDAIPLEYESQRFKRSLFIVRDLMAGEMITPDHVRSIRPAGGLHTKHLGDVVGKIALRDLKSGTPFEWGMINE